MNNCGGSTRPLTSGARTNARYFPSGDQRGVVSRGPLVSCRVSPLAVVTVQIAVLYPSFLSLTVTRTKATREPSGESCGSPIQTKLNRSFSVMFRFCASAAAAKETTMRRRTETRTTGRETRRRILEFLSVNGVATRRGYCTGGEDKVGKNTESVIREDLFKCREILSILRAGIT